MRILHIDDYLGWRNLVQELLSGHEVTNAGTAIEGLEIFEDMRPDFVIVDSEMPGISGLQMVAILLEHGYPPNKILMFSTSPFTGTKALELGVKFLVKSDAWQLSTIVASGGSDLPPKTGPD